VALPTRIPKRHEQSLHRRAPGFPPSDAEAGSHMSCERTENRRSQTAARETGNRPTVISVPSSSPKPAGERAGHHVGGVQPHHGCAPFSASSHPVGQREGPGPHVMQPAQRLLRARNPCRHSRQCRVSSTAESVPRLEAALRMTQQCQLSTTIMGQSATGGGATVDMAKSGQAVIVAADERKQRSNRLQARVPS
jgi:hypothetical protein